MPRSVFSYSHSFTKYSLGIRYVPDTVLGIWNSSVRKKKYDNDPCSHSIYILAVGGRQ